MYHAVTLPGIPILPSASPINYSVIVGKRLDNKIEHYSTGSFPRRRPIGSRPIAGTPGSSPSNSGLVTSRWCIFRPPPMRPSVIWCVRDYPPWANLIFGGMGVNPNERCRSIIKSGFAT